MYKLSIVIPYYNSKPYIARLLKSIEDEELGKENVEVILVDDCSTEDYSREIQPFRKTLDLKIYRTEFNKGKPAHARNIGIKKAKGEWITFADHDDYFIKNGLKTVLEHIDEIGNLPYFITDSYEENTDTTTACDWLIHGSFYKVEWLKNFDLYFNERLNIFEDIEFNHRVQKIIVPQNNGRISALDILTYYWTKTKNSLGSKQTHKGFEFFTSENYNDFLAAYLEPYLEEPIINKGFNIYELITNIYHMYYYFQLWKCKGIDEKPFLRDTHDILMRVYQEYQINTDFICNFCIDKNIFSNLVQYVGHGYLANIVPEETLRNFLDRMITYNVTEKEGVLPEAPFDGKPSIDLGHRPWVTIVIPCYNSGPSLPKLLDSIIAQNMNDDIEVILSDDWSTKPYQDVVDNYKDTLCIKQIKTDYNFGPGNTREKGVSIATGEWVMFADHDDEFVPNTFMKCRNEIAKANEKYFAIANFYEQEPKTKKILAEMKKTKNWNHAKFYNLDNLWRAYDIHFKKDLTSHEDIYISSQVNCAMMDCQGGNPLFIDEFIYIWNKKDNSISRQEYGGHEFLEVFYKDYIDSTGTVYLDNYERGVITKDYALVNIVQILGYCYFYMQGFIYHQGKENYFRDNENYAREYLIRLKNVLKITNYDIMYIMSASGCRLYRATQKTAYSATGPIIEPMSLEDWLNYLHKDPESLKTVKSFMSKEGAENY